ncbi:acid-sensing ion channel 2-like [Bolinopsis microptera]|uniref:acid-sensing ion channel 2-like n=1 Tax=Bolinopsis microptera TaxID=2820187 RepID=UPI00307905CD
MESASSPHTIGSVLLPHERRPAPQHVSRSTCPEHVSRYHDHYYHPSQDPSYGFNSVIFRPGSGYCGGDSWQDEIPRYVSLRDQMGAARDYTARGQSFCQRHRQSGFQESKRAALQEYRENKDYDLVRAARAAAAAKESTNAENYCEIGSDTAEPSTLTLNPEELKKTPKPVVESFSDFMQAITASFIRFIFEEDSPPFRRVLWFVFWVICCGYALSNIHAAFTQYFAFDTSSQLSFTYNIGGKLTMPAITICNLNKYRKSWLNQSENLVVKKYEIARVWGPDVLDELGLPITEADNRTAKQLLILDLEKSGKHGIYDMFKQVIFDEEELTDGEVDIREHITERRTELGVCYTFNADGTKTVKRTGNDFGATFIININQSEYADTQESAGIKVMLHHYKEPPLIKEYGLAIPPGSEAYISTRTLRINNLGQPYFNCTSRPLMNNTTYSVVACQLECHAQILDEECKCKQSHMPLENITICSLFTHHDCTVKVIKRIHQGFYEDRIKGCWCIDPCTDTYYEYKLSRAQYPPLNAATKLLGLNEDYNTVSDLRENFIRLHVYFETLAIENVQKVPAYTTMNLLGDVGGNLGLFIGANVATLGELIDYCARRIHVWANVK